MKSKLNHIVVLKSLLIGALLIPAGCATVSNEPAEPDNAPRKEIFYAVTASNQLIAFNCLLHRDGVLLDKYIGMQQALAKKYNIYFLSWLHNIEMCIRDGFHTFQSGQAAYETKLKLGASLTPTFIFFKHKNRFLNQLLKLASRVLAYANFDKSVR